MLKEQRKILEELSFKAFGKKHYYQKIEKYGLLNKIDGMLTRIRLTDEGIKLYLEKTIKAREDFLKAHEILKKKETKVGESNEQSSTS